jgi:hypothetical protein
MGEACSTHGEMRNAYNILVGKPEGRRSLGISSRIWKDNIRIDFCEMWEGVKWIHLAQDRNQWSAVVNTKMTYQVP